MKTFDQTQERFFIGLLAKYVRRGFGTAMRTQPAVESLQRGRIAVRLTPKVQEKLASKLARGSCLARTLKKARALQLLGEGCSIAEVAKAVGVCGNTVRTVESRYIAEGLNSAINDKSRPGVKRRIDARAEASLVAMVCSSPPEGLSKWSMSVIALECVHRGIVSSISKATVCRILHRHALKPWREKNVVRA